MTSSFEAQVGFLGSLSNPRSFRIKYLKPIDANDDIRLAFTTAHTPQQQLTQCHSLQDRSYRTTRCLPARSLIPKSRMALSTDSTVESLCARARHIPKSRDSICDCQQGHCNCQPTRAFGCKRACGAANLDFWAARTAHFAVLGFGLGKSLQPFTAIPFWDQQRHQLPPEHSGSFRCRVVLEEVIFNVVLP